ncbi:hypothetical protein BYT27DRAFT_7260186 [Phlegmacium glaucopus]|nr:hypothetical protein BYT27DRAFT_7260186 [Phlegmacium glaucopus]
MHLIWENLIPNLILFWTGEFKDLDHQGKSYVIEPHIWNEIGVTTAACGATIPAAFRALVPNIAMKRSQMTAEMYANWTLYIAPLLCLVFEIDEAMLNQIDEGFKLWVEGYERLYYRNDPTRLSACPLTIHALLHIAWGIRAASPVWTYWAFPMEHHCNTLLPSIRSRRHPYASISSFVTAIAQLNQIQLLYNLDEALCLDPDKKESNKLIHNLYPLYMLSAPRRHEILPSPIQSKVLACLVMRFNVKKNIVQSVIKLNQPITQYGRVTRLEGGDCMIGRDLVQGTKDSHDTSFYTQFVDRYTRQKRRRPEFELQDFFGQLKHILILELPSTPQLNLATPTTIILALIQSIKATIRNNIYYYKEIGVDEVVDLTTFSPGTVPVVHTSIARSFPTTPFVSQEHPQLNEGTARHWTFSRGSTGKPCDLKNLVFRGGVHCLKQMSTIRVLAFSPGTVPVVHTSIAHSFPTTPFVSQEHPQLNERTASITLNHPSK